MFHAICCNYYVRKQMLFHLNYDYKKKSFMNKYATD